MLLELVRHVIELPRGVFEHPLCDRLGGGRGFQLGFHSPLAEFVDLVLIARPSDFVMSPFAPALCVLP